MEKTFKFNVVTPTGVFYEDDVNFISFLSIDGEMGVMKNHTPMLVANKPCTLKIEKNKEEKYAYISEGFIEITNDQVSAVVDLADWSSDINKAEEIKAKKIAEEKLEYAASDKITQIELRASIERANARIKTSDYN